MVHILFVELLGGIGDVVIALPTIRALALTYPQACLTVLTFAPGGELLLHNPLHQVVFAPKGQAKETVEKILAQKSFDIIVSDTNYDGIAEVIRASGAQVVTNLWRNPPDEQRIGDRFLQILLETGVIAPETIFSQKPLIELSSIERERVAKTLGAAYRPLIFLVPDAGMPIKRWRTENFITLGIALQKQYGGTIIVPVGANQEQAIQIAQGIGNTAQIWQRDSLRELAAVIALADLVVGADTGIVQMAAALGVPTIILFGPSWHKRYGQPLPYLNLQGYPQCPERVISNFTQQSCWYSGKCPFDWDTCMDAITPEAVLGAASKLLSREAVPQSPSSSVIRSNAPCPVPHALNNSWSTVRNLLVMRLDNIGDVIMTSPALRSLKENLPQVKITLMASPGGALAAPLLPWVDQVLSWRVLWQNLGRLAFDPAREWELIESLASHKFDAVIIFTSFSQSPHPAALVCYLAGIPLRLGESKEAGGILTHEAPQTPNETHQVERNLRLIESVGFKVRDRRLSLQPPTPYPLSPTPYILLNPWTSCQSRNYDVMRFAAAARQLSQITGYKVIITGVEKDRDRSRPLLEVLGECAIDLIGKTSLSELAALIAKARLVITNNTSTMHIADATNTPAVIMFAGTELECQWQPRFTPAKLLRRPTVCSPCYAFTCPYSLECLDIPPEAVVAAGLELLQQSI